MSKPSFELGRLVISKQGRDAGRPFVIIEMLESGYVLIADGDLRKTERPKKKKVKHLIPKPVLLTIETNTGNSEIRKAIQASLTQIGLKS